MTESKQSDSSNHGERPGKTRTMWHPLLVRMLTHALSNAFTVVGEVLVGKMPLQVDILLIRRERGQLSESGRREIAALVPLLNRFTLMEFKGPTDSLERGDFAHLVGCAFLWLGQQTDVINHEDVSLIVLAPTINAPFRDELRQFGCEAIQHEPGVFRMTGLPFTIWLVETDAMADHGEPILSLVSRIFLKDRRRIIKQLAHSDETALLRYMMQFVEESATFDEDFIMEGIVDDPKALKEEILTAILEELSAERRLQGLPANEVARLLPPEERVRGLSLEERLAGLGLSEAEAAQVFELLKHRQGKGE